MLLKDVDFTDLSSLIQFMYEGEVSIPANRLDDFLQTAKTLEVTGITDHKYRAVSMLLLFLPK